MCIRDSDYGLIDELEKQASKRNIEVHILLQVNIAREEMCIRDSQLC